MISAEKMRSGGGEGEKPKIIGNIGKIVMPFKLA
jgi:hypothetical protein